MTELKSYVPRVAFDGQLIDSGNWKSITTIVCFIDISVNFSTFNDKNQDFEFEFLNN